MITPSKPPVARPAFDIVVGGEKTGTIEPYMDSQWHALINLTADGVSYHTSSGVLIQGFGDSHEAVIADAIQSGIRYHEGALVAIREFQAKLQQESAAEPIECLSCKGCGYFDEEGNPTIDRRCRKCLDCTGTGKHP